MKVAETIRQQLGNKALFMLGAKALCGGLDSLSFKIGRNDKGVTHIRIRLTPDDLYNVEFLRIRRFEIETLASCDGIYADMLHSVIESETGLYTSMGAMG